MILFPQINATVSENLSLNAGFFGRLIVTILQNLYILRFFVAKKCIRSGRKVIASILLV